MEMVVKSETFKFSCLSLDSLWLAVNIGIGEQCFGSHSGLSD